MLREVSSAKRISTPSSSISSVMLPHCGWASASRRERQPARERIALIRRRLWLTDSASRASIGELAKSRSIFSERRSLRQLQRESRTAPATKIQKANGCPNCRFTEVVGSGFGGESNPGGTGKRKRSAEFETSLDK